MKEQNTPPSCADNGRCASAETSMRLIDNGWLPARQLDISQEQSFDTLTNHGKCIECYRRLAYHTRRGVIIKF